MKNLKLIIICVLLGFLSKAQTAITNARAYQMAVDNNLEIKNGLLKIDAQKALSKTGFSLDPTTIDTQIGQFNSAYNDTQFSISQGFHFPGFYKKQKQVEIEKWKKEQLNLTFQKRQLKHEINLIFNDLNYYDAKIGLLNRADSLYRSYYAKAKLRLEKGEANILEKATAENNSAQIKLELLQVIQQKAISLEKLNFLINDGKEYVNKAQTFIPLTLNLQPVDFSGHPEFQAAEQEENVQKAITSKLKSTQSPTISVGYSNMSLRGANDNGGFNNMGKRFQYGNVGLSIPLFSPLKKQELEAQKLNESMAHNNRELTNKKLQADYRNLMIQYHSIQKQVELLGSTSLKNADLILKTANLQFINGEINYLDYVLLVNQALAVRNQNLESLRDLNTTIINLNSLQEN